MIWAEVWRASKSNVSQIYLDLMSFLSFHKHLSPTQKTMISQFDIRFSRSIGKCSALILWAEAHWKCLAVGSEVHFTLGWSQKQYGTWKTHENSKNDEKHIKFGPRCVENQWLGMNIGTKWAARPIQTFSDHSKSQKTDKNIQKAALTSIGGDRGLCT